MARQSKRSRPSRRTAQTRASGLRDAPVENPPASRCITLPPLRPACGAYCVGVMEQQLTLTPPREPFDAEIAPPGSKSLTNRALVLAALADGGVSTLTNVLFADDTLVMMECLSRL